MSPRSGREGCAWSPPPRCCGAQVRGASPARARRSGYGLCLPLLPPGSAPPAGGRLLVPQRPAVRSGCSGGDSRELGDARCPHGQAAAARTSPTLLQRLPVFRGQGCAEREPRDAGVVNLTQVAGGCGQRREGVIAGRTRGLPTARAAGAARVPCPEQAPLSLGHRAPQRRYARESERSQPALR